MINTPSKEQTDANRKEIHISTPPEGATLTSKEQIVKKLKSFRPHSHLYFESLQ